MSMTRHVAIVGTATLVSRVLGFVRDVAIASLFGAGPRADAFVVAFQFNNLVRRLLTEGALNAAFVPRYLKRRSESGAAAAGMFAGQVTGTITLALMVVAVVLGLAMPVLMLVLAPGFGDTPERLDLAIEMARLMLPYLILAGPIAVLMGVLNANHRYAAAATTAILFNVVVIMAIAIVVVLRSGDSNRSAWIVAGSIAAAGLCQLALVATAVLIKPVGAMPLGLLPSHKARSFAALTIPGLIASGVPQLTMIAGAILVSDMPGAVSFLYYANRLVDLPLGVVGMAVGTVLTPNLAHRLSEDRGIAQVTLRHGIELTLGLALPAAAGLVVLAQPMIAILFQRGAFGTDDVAMTSLLLMALALGLPGHVLVKTLSAPFFVHEDTRFPMIAVTAGLLVSVIAGLSLVSFIGPFGVALAIALSGWVSAALLFAVARRRGLIASGVILWRRMIVIALATAVMAIAVWILADRFGLHAMTDTNRWLRALQLAAVIVSGLVIYAACLWLSGIIGRDDRKAA